MQKSYESGVATHIGPESCGAARKGGVEALTGERAGRVLSRVSEFTPGRRRCKEKAEGPIGCTDIARCARVPRGQRPRARTQTPRSGNREIPGPPKSRSCLGTHREV